MTTTTTTALTENGAVAHATTGHPIIDLFFQAVRGVETDKLAGLVSAAFAADPLMTLKLLFHRRDVRGGIGERRVFTDAIQHLATVAPASVARNFAQFPMYGRWDDLCVFYLDPAHSDAVMDLFFRQLRADIQSTGAVSLCAKWFPSENSLRFPHFATKFCKKFGLTKRALRKTYLTPLRTKLEIVETFLCKKAVEQINFERVPSRAMLMYRAVFARSAAFQAYMARVAAKETTVKARCIDPHEIIRAIATAPPAQHALLEAQWAQKQAEITPGKNVLCVCDVSASMKGVPMEVCIALGLLISSCADEAFKDLIVTFSSTPAFHRVAGDTLAARISSLAKAEWGMTTNIEAVFELVLARALAHKLPQADLPERILILSDVIWC